MKKYIVISFSLIVFFLTDCNQQPEGAGLAKKYCQSCHMLPQPGLLDKNTWASYVLPKMGDLVGFGHFDGGSYYEKGNQPDVMLLSEWKKIVQYYISAAPDSLAKIITVPLKKQLENFDIYMPAPQMDLPATTYVGINGAKLFYGDAISRKLHQDNLHGLSDSFSVEEGIVNIALSDSTIRTLCMGVLYPSDEKKGSLSLIDRRSGKSDILIDSLQRPVFAEYADLNQDNREDIIVCEFGNTTGELSWFEKLENGAYQKHILRALPGAIKTQVSDLDQNGLPDIIVLMAQGDEGIFAYINKGNNQFVEKRLVQLAPSYGSNYFEMADFNKDGYSDLLVTNGDNGDYPPVMKPYHGIRIYLNDGKNNFTEKSFLHVNGVGKAIARDFDGDGDLDIASISYFPDYEHQPEESFIYWENVLPFTYRPFIIKEALAGRWLTMDAGDVDGDGDLDIVLGNAKFTVGRIPDWLMKKWDRGTPPFLLLKNRLHP